MRVLGAYSGHAWVDWSWVGDHLHEILSRLTEHAILLAWSMLFAVLIAVPLALVSVRRRRVYGGVLATTGVLYTIPSLAAFSLLLPAGELPGVAAQIMVRVEPDQRQQL